MQEIDFNFLWIHEHSCLIRMSWRSWPETRQVPMESVLHFKHKIRTWGSLRSHHWPAAGRNFILVRRKAFFFSKKNFLLCLFFIYFFLKKMLASGVEFLVLNLEAHSAAPIHPMHLHIQPRNLFLGSMKLLPMQPVCCFSWQWPLRPSHSSAG